MGIGEVGPALAADCASEKWSSESDDADQMRTRCQGTGRRRGEGVRANMGHTRGSLPWSSAPASSWPLGSGGARLSGLRSSDISTRLWGVVLNDKTFTGGRVPDGSGRTGGSALSSRGVVGGTVPWLTSRCEG